MSEKVRVVVDGEVREVEVRRVDQMSEAEQIAWEVATLPRTAAAAAVERLNAWLPKRSTIVPRDAPGAAPSVFARLFRDRGPIPSRNVPPSRDGGGER